MKSAIVLGATGLTGSILLKKLLQDQRYHQVKVFGRRTTGRSHPKLQEHLVDLLELEQQQELFNADEVFCCIGTTKAKTPDNETYRKIDYGIPVTAAKLSKHKGIDTFVVISALAADPDSRIFYNRTKGEMERDVLKQDLPRTFILQPSLISGNREEQRFFESFVKWLMKLGNHLLHGPLKKYRSILPETIASAMIKLAHEGYSKARIPSDEIKMIAGK